MSIIHVNYDILLKLIHDILLKLICECLVLTYYNILHN